MSAISRRSSSRSQRSNSASSRRRSVQSRSGSHNSSNRARRGSDDGSGYESDRRKSPSPHRSVSPKKHSRRHGKSVTDRGSERDKIILYCYPNGRGTKGEEKKFQFTRRELRSHDNKLEYIQDKICEKFGFEVNRSKLYTTDGLLITGDDQLIQKGVYVIAQGYSKFAETYYVVPVGAVDTALPDDD